MNDVHGFSLHSPLILVTLYCSGQQILTQDAWAAVVSSCSSLLSLGALRYLVL